MDESSIRENRKDEHVQLALTAEKAARSDFDDLTFIHRSLPETNLDEIDLTAKVGNLQWDSPLYINAMTGGSVNTGAINAQLAEAAAKTGIAIAVGSQHSGLRKASLADTYKVVRKKIPLVSCSAMLERMYQRTSLYERSTCWKQMRSRFI